MTKIRVAAVSIILLGIVVGFFAGSDIIQKNGYFEKLTKVPAFSFFFRPYRLGLDLQGGTHLVYRADFPEDYAGSKTDAMSALRDVIERRINLFGVAEPLVQTEISGDERRLIVELAGVSNINDAKKLIGETPFLEFKTTLPFDKGGELIHQKLGKEGKDVIAEVLCAEEQLYIQFLAQYGADPCFQSIGFDGKYLQKAVLEFDQQTNVPTVSLQFTGDGAKQFAIVTEQNVGKPLAIFLDGLPIEIPVVREKISEGRAQITGSFTPDQAKALVGRLNAGALPVPITRVAEQNVEASLGQESLVRSFNAAIWGFLAVIFFMILWYRLPGLIAVVALLVYISIVLSIFKLIPVTLTAAGIAGFVLSIGMAVDANILIFERFKEELKKGRSVDDALRQGFERAWTSIRDSNVSSLITAAVLFWLGTSVVKGFALTLGIGVLVSMFSAISVSRTFLLSILTKRLERVRFILLSGFSR
ncbi:MAG: protein translocase subunit SecD [bacterium]|nr:protein translocase subunit SecD [bacterium]